MYEDYRSQSEIMRDELYDFMIEYEICTEAELGLASNLCGFNLETMERCLYARTGYTCIEQITEEWEEEE